MTKPSPNYTLNRFTMETEEFPNEGPPIGASRFPSHKIPLERSVKLVAESSSFVFSPREMETKKKNYNQGRRENPKRYK